MLAFYTKQYSIACLGYIAFYLFLAESKKRAMAFGLAALAAFIVAIIFVPYTLPYYFDNTFFAVQSVSKIAFSYAHLITQFKEYTLTYIPLLIILAA